MSTTLADAAALPIPGALAPETAAQDYAPRCLLTERISRDRLRELIAASPDAIKGSIDDVERGRTLQLQWFRVGAYLVSGFLMILNKSVVGTLWGVPVLVGIANVIAFLLLRRVVWFRGLNCALFMVDILVSELLIWHNGVVITPMTMWLPIVVLAMAFFLPARSAVSLSIFMAVIHVGLILAQSSGAIPVGQIISNATTDFQALQTVLQNHWQRDANLMASGLLLLGSMYFAVYVFGLLRQREYELTRANEAIRRYVPAQLADQILSGNYSVAAAHERRKLTIFFSDIVGFTEAADQLEAEDLSRVLNEYLSEMALIAEKHGGTIDKFVGDAILVLFGAPVATNDKDHAVRAVCMARQMQHRMRELTKKWFEEGIQIPFQVRMGINTGAANVGSYGSPGRMDYTAIGQQVNLAARLQSNCAPGKVLISHSTWALVKDEIGCTPKGEIQVKGIHYPVKVYEIDATEGAEAVHAPRLAAVAP
ncbi:MAG: adenylate/guanylate cyclase domain-containing protein [Bdellovibrionota bacterium]